MSAAFLIPLLALAAPAEVEPQNGGGGECIVRELSSITGLEARFREEKHLTLLKEPLISEGSLFYSAPDLLLRRVDAPIPSRLLLRGDELIVDGPNGSRSLRLSENPGMRIFVDTFRMLLAGDLIALRQTHQVDFRSGSAGCADWSLRLRPLRPGPVTEIHVAGSGRIIEKLAIHDKGGNQTRIRFSEVDPARRFDDEERARLFAVSAP